MSEGFDDFSLAAKMRDVITKIAEDAVNRLRPPDMIGEVYSYEIANRIAYIKLPGHSEEELIRAKYGPDKVPLSSITAPFGDVNVVRVSGKPGSYYITDYLRGECRQLTYEWSVIPVAGMIPYFGTNPPLGFLFCDGAWLSQAVYFNLFSRIGHKANGGVDPGDGTFKLPDMTDVGVVGAGARAVGEYAGQETRSLTVDQMPSHDHVLTFSENTGLSGQNLVRGTQTQFTTSRLAIENEGSGQAFSMLTPVIGVNWIIRT